MIKMKIEIHFIDLLSYLLSWRKRTIKELLVIIDKYYKNLNIPFILCIQKGKGFDYLHHPNILFLEHKQGIDEDLPILELSRKFNGYIVSNDKFRQYPEYETFVKERRISHRIKKGMVELYIPNRMETTITKSSHKQKMEIPA